MLLLPQDFHGVAEQFGTLSWWLVGFLFTPTSYTDRLVRAAKFNSVDEIKIIGSIEHRLNADFPSCLELEEVCPIHFAAGPKVARKATPRKEKRGRETVSLFLAINQRKCGLGVHDQVT